MAGVLLTEHAGNVGNILVVGAGGGLEVRALAQFRRQWSFTGVDPSAEMLALARGYIAPFADQVHLIQGTVEDAPAGPFDGATCFLTMHFLNRSERLAVLQGIHRRLAPGASLIMAHHCSPGGDSAEAWLARSIAFSSEEGKCSSTDRWMAKEMAARLTLLTPTEEEAMARAAGFSKCFPFYAGFSFRGWVATA